MKTIQRLGLGLVLATLFTTAANATITLVSDGSTLGSAVPVNDPRLSSGDITGLTFSPVTVGAFGTYTPVPGGAPAGTQVIYLTPGDGESGFFMVTFILPTGFSGASFSGAANVDDGGSVFLNGFLLSSSLREFGDATFSTSDNSIFHAGLNQLIISDNNYGGGPSGAAFYANIDYSDVPEPTTLISGALLLLPLGASTLRMIRKNRAA